MKFEKLQNHLLMKKTLILKTVKIITYKCMSFYMKK